MRNQTEANSTTIAKMAASRAEALRTQAATLTSEALAPLRKALLVRAAELDLAADVLIDPDAGQRPIVEGRHLQTIA
jgi:hypothetical protein